MALVSRARHPPAMFAAMIVIVHGYEGSGAGHWQHWLSAKLGAGPLPFAFPQLPKPLAPEREEWVTALARVVADSADPVLFVAHSLGCWAVDHYLKTHGATKVRAALLVTPPSPFSLFEPIQSFLPPPRDAAVWSSIAAQSLLIGSDNDDHAGPEEIQELAERLRIEHRILEGVGHINTASGFGPFPLAEDWLRQFVSS